MDNKTKENAIGKIVKAMGQMPDISNLAREKDSQGWRVKCTVYGAVQFSIALRREADLAIIRAEIATGMEEAETVGLGNEMTEDMEELRFSAYGEKLSLQRACTLENLMGQEAERFLFVKAFSVVEVIKKFKNRIVPGEDGTVLGRSDMESEERREKLDLYALFDRVSAEYAGDERLKNEKSVPLRDASIPFDNVDGFLSPMIPATGNEKNVKHERSKKSGNRAGYDGVDALASLPIEYDEKAKTGVCETEMERQEQNTADAGADGPSGMEEISQMLKEIQEEEDEEESENLSCRSFDSISQKTDADSGGQKEKVHDTDKSVGEPENVVVAQTDMVKDAEMEDKIEELEHMQGLDPEVAAQMREMYEEIGRIFDLRKKQADQRESTLNAFAGRLDKREKMIWERAENAQRIFKEKLEEGARLAKEQKKRVEAECQESISRIEAEKEKISVLQKDISYQREKLQAEKDILETQKRDFEERMALAEKSQALSGMMENELADLEESRKNLEKSRRENMSLRERMKSMETQYSEKIAKITDVSKKKDEVINKLKAQVEQDTEERGRFAQEMEKTRAENRELQDSIEKLQEEAEEYLEHIGRLDAQIEAEKERAQDADRECEKEREEKEQAIAELREVTDTEKIASRVQKQLKEIGIDVDPVAGASGVVLAGESGQYRIIVDAEIGVIRVEKSLRRGQKHRVIVDRWNEEDMGTAYLLSATKIVCKAGCRDVQKAVMDIMRRLDGIK